MLSCCWAVRQGIVVQLMESYVLSCDKKLAPDVITCLKVSPRNPSSIKCKIPCSGKMIMLAAQTVIVSEIADLGWMYAQSYT